MSRDGCICVMKFRAMAEIDLARFTFALDEYAKEVSDLVATVFAVLIFVLKRLRNRGAVPR